jgi:hypothetical protein
MTHYLVRAEGVTSDLAVGSGCAAVIFSEELSVPLMYTSGLSLPCEHGATLFSALKALDYVWNMAKKGDTVSIETRFGTQIAFPPRDDANREFVTACVAQASEVVQFLVKEGIDVTFDRYGPEPDEHLVRHASSALMSTFPRRKSQA